MNQETIEKLEEIQEELRELAEEEKLSYSHDGVYGMMIMLDSVLSDSLSVQDAVNEFIANSDLEVQVELVETQVVHK